MTDDGTAAGDELDELIHEATKDPLVAAAFDAAEARRKEPATAATPDECDCPHDHGTDTAPTYCANCWWCIEPPTTAAAEASALMEAERHEPDMLNGGCKCGFCAWSIPHVVIMAVRSAVAGITPDSARTVRREQ